MKREHNPEYTLWEKAEIEYALKHDLIRSLRGEIHEESYIPKARALRKTMKTDNTEYWKPIHELSDKVD